MSTVEAWVCSWNEHKARMQAELIQSLCGVRANVLVKYDHEARVINEAMSRCRADYFWYVEQDIDLLFPHTASIMAEWLDEHPDVGLIRPNREAEPPYTGGRYPFDKYIDDGTAWMYRMAVGAKWDEEFIFTGWADLDWGENINALSYRTQVETRVSVRKHFTAYGSWSAFRRAYNARNRLLLEAKWWWSENWQGVDDYNATAERERRIPTMFELAWWSDDRLNAFADSVYHEHPQILIAAGQGPGNENWRMPDA